MWSQISLLSVLILMINTLMAGSEAAHPSVEVKLHDSATVPCSEKCTGLVRWTQHFKPTETLAECDLTSCRSVKEGYQMIHDQYLNGDLSLIITDTDFTKRGWYTCECNGKDVCDVTLKFKSLNTTVHVKSGEPVVLDLDVSDPVEVIYNSAGTANRSSGQICTVDGRSARCEPKYTERVSLVSALELRGATPYDSGVYSVMDTINEEVIHTYTVTVQGGGDGGGGGSEAQRQTHTSSRNRRSPQYDCQPISALPEWVVPVLSVLTVAVAGFLAGCVVLAMMTFRLRSEVQQLRRRREGNEEANRVQNGVPMNTLGMNGAAEQQRLAPDKNDQEAV